MRKLLERLAATRALWVSGLATLVLTLLFGAWIGLHDLHIIDEIWREAAIREVVDGMSAAQRRAHVHMTLGLDIAYPFAYGSFLSGLAWRAWGRAWLAVPALATIPFDLAEGAAQVALLSGHAEGAGEWGYAVKGVATPLKLGGFGLAVLLGLAAAAVMIWRRARGDAPRQNEKP